ncbi:acylphosphatase [Anaerostipes sp. MSJ-23]|uniref:acylphosphatase n=1 Tax=unclassified Anaerostipes TaxID=2635253 RepID=UPI001C10DF9F|nr:acylphosphatase [Anaerostipes sp. MSJ-23]MBU5459008.1 acylphosphatase [Anaerostipes sp. MSJ-23]
MVRYYFRFIGRVQGVGFRFFVCMNAERCHLTGWVRNLPDGSVEAEVQGTKVSIQQFLEQTKNDGHRFIRIDEVQSEERSLKDGEKKFKVVY